MEGPLDQVAAWPARTAAGAVTSTAGLGAGPRSRLASRRLEHVVRQSRPGPGRPGAEVRVRQAGAGDACLGIHPQEAAGAAG
jgi:hypothetical protein